MIKLIIAGEYTNFDELCPHWWLDGSSAQIIQIHRGRSCSSLSNTLAVRWCGFLILATILGT